MCPKEILTWHCWICPKLLYLCMSQCGFPGKQTLRKLTGEDPQHQGVVRGKEGWGLGRGRSDCTAYTKASGDPTGSSGARRAPRQSLESITFLLRQVISLKLTEEVPEVTLGKAAHPSWGQCLGRGSAESVQRSLSECFTPQAGGVARAPRHPLQCNRLYRLHQQSSQSQYAGRLHLVGAKITAYPLYYHFHKLLTKARVIFCQLLIKWCFKYCPFSVVILLWLSCLRCN